MEIGYVEAEFSIFVCCECYEDDFTEPEIIYNDYEDLPLGDINHQWKCVSCKKTFIGNIR